VDPLDEDALNRNLPQVRSPAPRPSLSLRSNSEEVTMSLRTSVASLFAFVATIAGRPTRPPSACGRCP